MAYLRARDTRDQNKVYKIVKITDINIAELPFPIYAIAFPISNECLSSLINQHKTHA